MGRIGKAIAVSLAASGTRTVVNGRTKTAGKAVVAEIRGAGGDALPVRGDVLVMDDMHVLARATLDHYDRINGLVASAGGFIDPIVKRNCASA